MGAVGIYTASQMIRTGLQHLMAGSRNFNLSTIMRRDLMILPEECENATGIPYVMRACRKEAEKILESPGRGSPLLGCATHRGVAAGA